MKRKLTKALALLLALAMVLSLGACGSTGTDSVPAAETSSVQNEEVSEPAVEATPEAEPEEEPEASEEPISAVETEGTEETTEAEETTEEPVFQEQVVVDNEYCSVTLTDIIDFGDRLYWDLTFENKWDRELHFLGNYLSVNGIACNTIADGYVVAAGETETGFLVSRVKSMEDYGITGVTVANFKMKVYYRDDNDNSVYLVNDYFTVYPYGEDAAEYVAYEPQIVLVDNDDMSIAITNLHPDTLNYTMDLWFINKTESALSYGLYDDTDGTGDTIKVNGIDIDLGDFYVTVAPGQVTYETVTLGSLNQLGIDAVESIELPVYAVYSDQTDENFDIFWHYQETFTVNP